MSNSPAGSSFLQGGGGVSLQGGSGVSTLQPAAGTLRLQPAASSATVGALSNPAGPSVPAQNATLANGQNLLTQYSNVPAPVYAPTLDFAAINAQANAAAQNNVNPYYVKSLNDFMAQQATTKAQQQAQTSTNIQNLKDTLTNTTSANAVTGARTTEDTAQKEADTAQAADWRQTDQGGQYDIDRVAQAVTQAKSGLTGSGLAGGQDLATQNKFNTTESRQATTDQQSNQAAELAKARTFEDLGTSNTLAGQTENKGETQANVDLTNFITNQGFDLKNEQNDLEQKRLQAVATEQQNQSKLLINQFVNSIANPAQRQAAISAYGNAF